MNSEQNNLIELKYIKIEFIFSLFIHKNILTYDLIAYSLSLASKKNNISFYHRVYLYVSRL